VHLVDEQDDLALGRRHLVEHAFSRSSNSPRYFAPAMSAPMSSASSACPSGSGHVAVDDAQRQALDDGGLADAGLADQHRGCSWCGGQHLDRAADLLVAADDRVELAVRASVSVSRRTFFSASLPASAAAESTVGLCGISLIDLVEPVGASRASASMRR
jgi:hypothetical protein